MLLIDLSYLFIRRATMVQSLHMVKQVPVKHSLWKVVMCDRAERALHALPMKIWVLRSEVFTNFSIALRR